MKIKLLFTIVLLSMIALVSSADPDGGRVNIGENISLNQVCFVNGTICDNCNITTISYDGKILVSDIEMTKGATSFNYTFSQTDERGKYYVQGFCSYGSDLTKPFSGYFNVGGELETNYILIWIFSYIIIYFLLIKGIKIPLYQFIGFVLMLFASVIGLIMTQSPIGWLFIGTSMVIIVYKIVWFIYSDDEPGKNIWQ